jgi:hypothetical protein
MTDQPWLTKSVAVGEVPTEKCKLTNAELASRFRARFILSAPPIKAKPSKMRPRVFIKPFRRP